MHVEFVLLSPSTWPRALTHQTTFAMTPHGPQATRSSGDECDSFARTHLQTHSGSRTLLCVSQSACSPLSCSKSRVGVAHTATMTAASSHTRPPNNVSEMKCHRVNSHIIIRCDTTLTDPPNRRCPDIRTVLELQPVLWTQSKPSENQGDVRRGKEEDFCDGDLVGFECAVRVVQIEIGVPHPRIWM